MKTMLNSNLVRNGLFVTILLTSLLQRSVAGVQHPIDSLQPATHDSTKKCLTFDPELLVLSGLPLDEIADAPAIPLNKMAVKYVNDFVVKNARTLDAIRDKHPNTFSTMDAIFSRYDLPLELKYLAVIESELKTTARSKVGARGAWQLMPQTARDYKLIVKGGYDERTHLYKSTVAAAKYLNYLHSLFGDWLLVIAAYNGGPGTVYKAIKRSGSRNFWKLQHFLPAETRSHVKRFIGTHYYFEGAGSVTTLTKEEAQLYARKLTVFITKQNLLLSESHSEKPVEKSSTEEASSTATNSLPSASVKTVSIGEMRVDEEE